MFNWHKTSVQSIKNIKPKSIFFSVYGGNLSPTVEELLKSTLSSELGISLDEDRSISEIASPNFFLLSKPFLTQYIQKNGRKAGGRRAGPPGFAAVLAFRV